MHEAIQPAVATAMLELLPDFVGVEEVFERHGGRTSIYVCRTASREHPKVVVKLDRDRADAAARTFAAFEAYQEALSDVDGVGSPAPLGWCSDPPLVATSFVPGRPVSELIRDRVARRPGSDTGQVTRAVALAGAALGALHRNLEAVQPTGRDVVRYAQRLFRFNPALTAECSAAPVRRVGDFATYNLMFDAESGVLYVLDPPEDSAVSPPHDDASYFLMTLMNSAVGVSSFHQRAGGRTLYDALSEAFLRCYGEHSGRDLCRTSDRRLLGWLCAYHAAMWGVRRLRGGAGLRRVGFNALGWAVRTRLSGSPGPWLRRGTL